MFQCIYTHTHTHTYIYIYIYAIRHLIAATVNLLTFLIASVMVSNINMGSNEQREPCAATSGMYGASLYMLLTQGDLVQ
jgi:hypothetical protein